ncbi:DUF3883 domain-containing protein [Paraburkholderia sp. RL18-103-BIB-C]|uniref:protein NO VEIN domain-containing protein n=1 Tax=Paraburkholderia sp. RL18-103-BIB-C TaxID=3031637 RepID=UPI0038B87A96
MPTFVAIKIHYDHRASLPFYLKYSVIPTQQQYVEYLKLFEDEGVGGNGFHECLNFAVGESDSLQFYLPPTCVPGSKREDDEFVFFSFTYKGDQELSAHIVGIHAGARLVNREGQARAEPFVIEGVEPLVFHGEAPRDLVTLISPPLQYDIGDGNYTPSFSSWGFGLRYIDEAHAANIVRDAIRKSSAALGGGGDSEKVVIERELEVLRRINARYALFDEEDGSNALGGKGKAGGLPDTEIGYRGERLVYDRELAYVRLIGKAESEVEWTSQAAPTSPFDIRTLRRQRDGTVREHFLEVKSSAMKEGENVYISSMQIEFFEKKGASATLCLVNFGEEDEPSVRELTLEELYAEFDLLPVKYKLSRRV